MERTCPRPGCGKPLAGRGPRAIYCSLFCARKASYDRFMEKNPDYHREWVKDPVKLEKKRASVRKWQRANAEQQAAATRAWLQAHPERARELASEKYARRKARRLSLPSEPVDRDLLRERQEGLCGLCSEPIDRALRYPDPMSESLDHIVPFVSDRCPGHVQGNCQLAHLVCNLRKSGSEPELAGFLAEQEAL